MSDRPPPSIHVTSVIGVNELLATDDGGDLLLSEFQGLCYRLTGEDVVGPDFPVDAELHLSLRVPAELSGEGE